jgi:hypothetical protein
MASDMNLTYEHPLEKTVIMLIERIDILEEKYEKTEAKYDQLQEENKCLTKKTDAMASTFTESIWTIPGGRTTYDEMPELFVLADLENEVNKALQADTSCGYELNISVGFMKTNPNDTIVRVTWLRDPLSDTMGKVVRVVQCLDPDIKYFGGRMWDENGHALDTMSLFDKDSPMWVGETEVYDDIEGMEHGCISFEQVQV